MDKTLSTMFPPVGDGKHDSKGKSLKDLSVSPHDELESSLKKMIEDMGISTTAIHMSQTGKQLLRHRLRASLGSDFERDKQAKKLLSKFDHYLDSYPDEARKKDMAAHAGAERTLEMLRKMS